MSGKELEQYEIALGIKTGFPQPKFSTLRLLLDINESNKDDVIINTNIKFKDFWIYDEHIHQNQFTPPIDLAKIKKPKKPKFDIFSIIPNAENKKRKALAKTKYEADLVSYNQKYEQAKHQNEVCEFFDSIKKAHKYTCYFCKFVDEKYIEIHHLDHDHTNNKKSNLVTACTLCHRQHHLLWLSVKDHAVIGSAKYSILDQTELNHLQRISIVMNHHKDESIKKSFGDQSLLSSIFSQYTNEFSRPLHSIMLEDEKKAKKIAEYIENDPFVFSRTGNKMKLTDLELAIDYLTDQTPTDLKKSNTPDNTRQQQANKDNLIANFHSLINFENLKELDKNTSDEDHIYRAISLLRLEIVLYRKSLEAKFHEEFNESTESFNCFDMALAIKSMPYKDFTELNLANYYLFFNQDIFTKEQIDYYLKLDYFKLENWNFTKSEKHGDKND